MKSPNKKKNRLPTAIGKAAQKNNCIYILNCLAENVKRFGKEMSDVFVRGNQRNG